MASAWGEVPILGIEPPYFRKPFICMESHLFAASFTRSIYRRGYALISSLGEDIRRYWRIYDNSDKKVSGSQNVSHRVICVKISFQSHRKGREVEQGGKGHG